MDEPSLNRLLKETSDMAARGEVSDADADDVLEQLQKAVQEHERILARQGELIARLRSELKDVRR